MIVKSQSSIVNSNDLQALIQLVCKLIGETCWEVNFSYGDELMLHFGERLPYPQACMSPREKGVWIFGTRISPWQVNLAGSIVADSEADSIDLIDRVRVLIGKKVLGAKIDEVTMQLSIEFTDSLNLLLIPESDQSAGLPDWELFMPNGMVIQAGRVWSSVDAD